MILPSLPVPPLGNLTSLMLVLVATCRSGSSNLVEISDSFHDVEGTPAHLQIAQSSEFKAIIERKWGERFPDGWCVCVCPTLFRKILRCGPDLFGNFLGRGTHQEDPRNIGKKPKRTAKGKLASEEPELVNPTRFPPPSIHCP